MPTEPTENEEYYAAYSGIDSAPLLRRKGLEGMRFRLLHTLGIAHQEISQKMEGAENRAIKKLESDHDRIEALKTQNQTFFDLIDRFASEMDGIDPVPMDERLDQILPPTYAALGRSELTEWKGSKELRDAEKFYRRVRNDRKQ